MKPLLVVLLVTSACHPSFDFDVDLDPGPVVGDRGFATLSFVDGCVGSDVLFGCPKHLPAFATDSRARFVIGSMSGDTDDEHRVERAKVTSSDSRIVIANRDDDGLLQVLPVGTGDATVELTDDGDVIDSIGIHIEPIGSLIVPTEETPTVLAGATFAAVVDAHSPSGERLWAHGAITPSTSGGLSLVPGAEGYFTNSEQFGVRGDVPGLARVEFRAGDAWTEGQFHLVSRDDITEVAIGEFYPEPGATKIRLVASAKAGAAGVRGGPACDWRIASGGGPGAALSPRVDDDLDATWLTLYNSAAVFGEGDVVVECRANDRVVAQHAMHLGR